MSAAGEDRDGLVDAICMATESSECCIATAESLSGGQLAAAFAAAPNASNWYRGGVIAYQPMVKYGLLESPPGPVVTAATASSMARSVGELLQADFSVAVTGVGGPGYDEGKPEGTVYLATWATGRDVIAEHHHFDGSPSEVIDQTVNESLRAILARIRGWPV